MKLLRGLIVAAALAVAAPALAQSPATVKLCVPTSPTSCVPVTATAPLPVSGSFSASLAGFTPNGNYTTLTATAASSASTTLPAGEVVAFQNLSSIDVSCVLTAGASTATTNKLIVRAGATVYYTVGSNTTAACINQTGVASNVVGLAGGAGLGTAFGGASAGGGGGGAITIASGAVASGAYSSGSIASGAFASGSVASGAFASGALASGSIAAGAMVDLLTMRGTVAAGTAAANSILTGCVYNSTPITLTNGQGAAVQCSVNGYPNVIVANTNANGQATMANSSPVTIASNQSANALWGQVATGAAPPANVQYVGANTSGATGGLVQGLIQCDSSAIYDASTSGSTELVALTSGRTIYVCGYSFMGGGTVNVKLVYGTGTNCASSPANITPAYQLTAQAGISDGSTFYRGLKTASANALCINASGATAVQAIVYYAKL